MQELLEQYIKSLAITHSGSKNTSESYDRDISGFVNFLEEKNIHSYEDVTKDDLYEYIGIYRSKKISNATYSRFLSALRSFYRYLNTNCGITNNPVSSIRGAKVKRELPDILSFDDVERLLDVFDLDSSTELRDRTIIETIYACGLRLSEVTSLNLDDIDLRNMTLRVIGIGSKMRIIPFYPRLKELIIRYLNEYRIQFDGDALFVSLRGTRISNRAIEKMLDKKSVEAGIKINVHPHILRHSFASHLLDNGADLRTVQELLGHENLSTTQTYTHLTLDRLKKTVNKAHPHSK